MDLALDAPRARLATLGGGGEIAFWSLATLERLGEVQAHDGRALSADFSPDGELLASAGEDGAVVLWHATRHAAVARLVHHRGAVRSVRFSPDGRFLASAGDDGSVRLWDLSRLHTPGEQVLASAEARSGVRLNGVKLELVGQGAQAR
jgi:WD40 repeat protein